MTGGGCVKRARTFNFIYFLYSARTFIHAVEQLVEVLYLAVVLVLLPRLPVLTPQEDELTLLPSQRAEVGDLHNHWSVLGKQRGAF